MPIPLLAFLPVTGKLTKFGSIIKSNHGRREVHDYFLLLLCRSSIWFTEIHIFKELSYIFWYIKTCRKLCHLIWGIWWFHRSKYFEVMKAGKSAIRPWLSWQYTENTLIALPSSVNQIVKVNLLISDYFYVENKSTVLMVWFSKKRRS